MEKIEYNELRRYLLDPHKDYRKIVDGYKLSKFGDLLIRCGHHWKLLIPKERLSDGEWLSDILSESNINYGQFVKAYLLACERAGIKQLTVTIYGLVDSYIFEEER